MNQKDQNQRKDYVSDAEYNYRLDICEGDTNYPPCEKYKESTGQCMSCGCFLKAKANLKNESCPLNKW